MNQFAAKTATFLEVSSFHRRNIVYSWGCAGGAVIGAIAGFVGTTYFDVFKAQPEFFISSMAGGFALLFGLTHLLHYDHS